MDVHDRLDHGPLAGIDPDRDPPAGLQERGQSEEGPARVGRVVEHADRVDVVERAGRERQPEQVTPDDGDRSDAGGQLGGREHGEAQVQADDQPRPHARRDPQVAPHPAPAVEDDLALEVRLRQPGSIAEGRTIFLGPEDPEPVPLQAIGRLGAILVDRGHVRVFCQDRTEPAAWTADAVGLPDTTSIRDPACGRSRHAAELRGEARRTRQWSAAESSRSPRSPIRSRRVSHGSRETNSFVLTSLHRKSRRSGEDSPISGFAVAGNSCNRKPVEKWLVCV